MPETTIRPTMKFIQIGFVLTLVVVIAAVVVHYQFLNEPDGRIPWLPLLAVLLLLFPLWNMVRRRFVTMTIKADKLYYEVGAISKSTRIIQIHKIQDVRVQQTLFQRMFGIGDLSIETAGETSRLTVSNLDHPKSLAEKILELAGTENARPRSI